MALKTNPKTLANGNFVGGTTFTLSVLLPSEGMMLKRETTECCVIVHLATLSGTSPTMAFDVDEFVDGNWIHVGTTGAASSAGDAVIDSSGGASSSGTFTFSATSNLRLLGKGTDLRIRTTPGGTVGTAQFTLSAIFYAGS